LAAYLTWWIGPLPDGIVDAVFPALAGILLNADDVLIIEVRVFFEKYLIVDGTENIEYIDLSKV
jgi:hypothetical protein